jgi:hypothetical protein
MPAPTQLPYPMYPMLPAPYQYPYGHPAPYSELREPVHHRQDIRSSSVVSSLDGVEKLTKYIAWLAQKNPTLAASLFEAKNALIEREFIFETVEHVTDDEFTQMGISRGIRVLLGTQTKRFKKAESKRM